MANRDWPDRPNKRQWPIRLFLAQTIATMKQHGYFTARGAEVCRTKPTWKRVVDLLGPAEPEVALQPEHFDQVEEIVNWALSLPDSVMDKNSHLHNLNVLAQLGVVKYRTAGLACSMVNEFHKQKESREKQRAN